MTVINAESLKMMDTGSILAVDCRNVMDDFEASSRLVKTDALENTIHVPQSPWMFNTDGSGGGRHPLPEGSVIDALYNALKAGEETQLLLFSDAGSFFHTRLYFLFQLYGYRAMLWNDTIENLKPYLENFKYPEVGLSAVDIEESDIEHDGDIFCSMEDVQKSLGSPGALLIDVRSRPRYLGDEEPVDTKMGHIPGAVNIPYPSIFKDGVIDLHALVHLENEFAQFREIIVYCGSGMSAAPVFLLLHHMGLPAKLYGGSFSEWITVDDNTVETGDSSFNGRMSRNYG